MENDGSINVELKLDTTSATAEARKFTETTRKEMMDKWRASLPAPNVQIYQPGASKPAGPGATVPYSGSGLATAPMLKLPAAAPPAPPKPMAVPPVLPQQQNVWQRMQGNLHKYATGLSASGMPGASALAASLRMTAAFGPVIAATLATVGLAFAGFKMALNQASQAARLYAKSLTSGGLPLGFTARRSNLASIIGVSEQDVLQYGDAIKFLNEKIIVSTRIMAATAPILTALNWEWKALMLDFHALGAQIATAVSPAMRMLIDTMKNVVTMVNLLMEVFGGLVKALVTIVSQVAKLAINGALGTILGPTISNIILGGLADINKKAPLPTASAHRLPTSTYERMGLVIGSGGRSDNSQKETASNTKKANELLTQIMHHLMPKSPLQSTGGYNSL